MKINVNKTNHPEIDIIELVGNLTSNSALDLYDYMMICFDKGKYFHIINFDLVKTIDYVGVSILNALANKGLNFALLNVDTEIREKLELSNNKKPLFMIYNETDLDNAVSMFERDVLCK